MADKKAAQEILVNYCKTVAAHLGAGKALEINASDDLGVRLENVQEARGAGTALTAELAGANIRVRVVLLEKRVPEERPIELTIPGQEGPVSVGLTLHQANILGEVLLRLFKTGLDYRNLQLAKTVDFSEIEKGGLKC